MKDTQPVRILVLGKSGCGKSALIRLFIGHDQCPSSQFMRMHHRDDLPITIYENDDADASNVDEMMAQMKRLISSPHPLFGFSKVGLDAVWYIFGASDGHVLEDGGLLQMLDKFGKKLPLLLVMTHEYDSMMRKETMVPQRKQEVVVEEVLRSISDSERRESLKASMLRIWKNEAEWDEEGLKLLFKRTHALIGRVQWETWRPVWKDVCGKLRKQAVRVLVLGEEREDVEAFLRAVTSRNDPDHQVTLSISTSDLSDPKAKREEDLDAIAAKAKPEEDLDAIAADRHNVSLPKEDHESRKGKEILTFDDETSTPFEPQPDDADHAKEKLQMAMWGCEFDSRMVVEFHQPLNINLLLDQDEDQMERAAIHPLDVHSPIRAKLNFDCPSRANCLETWRNWLHEDGIHLCIIILSCKESDMYMCAKDRLDRLLHRYYGQAMHHYVKVNVGSPVPLLIVHSGNGKELREALPSSQLRHVQVDTFSWNKEDETATATAVGEYVRRNVIHACTAIRQKHGTFQREIANKMSQMMMMLHSVLESYNTWLSWDIEINGMVHQSVELLRRSFDLDMLCHIWRVPQRLKQVLKTRFMSNAITPVPKFYILCIIIFCKWKCNDKFLRSEIEETTNYYLDMIDEALKKCQDLHQSLGAHDLPRAMLEELNDIEGKKKLYPYSRTLRGGIQLRWRNVWNDWKHPHKYKDAMLVLCKAYFDDGGSIKSVKKVELLFGSGEAMSRCIGIGIEGAIVRHSRGSRIIHVVEEEESSTGGRWNLHEMILEKGYRLLEVVTAATERGSNSGGKELYPSVAYGAHSEQKRPPRPPVGIHVVDSALGASESHEQRDDEERWHGVVQDEWIQSGHSPTSADARHINVRHRETCTYMRCVRVTLRVEGKIGDQYSIDWRGLRSIHPQLEFTFRFQSAGCKERVRSASITIISATEFALFSNYHHHDNIDITIGTNSSSTLDDSSSNNNWEDMIKSKKKRIPVQLPLSIDEQVIDRITICDGFAVENLSESHRAKFRLRHVSGKQRDVLNPGSHATVHPSFQMVFVPRDNDPAAPYTFEASRELYDRNINDEKPYRQTYEAKLFVNHAMSHITCDPENVEDREFVATNRPRFSFEMDDLQQPGGSDINYRMKVVVVGDDKEDVEAFVRAATNSRSPKRTFAILADDTISKKDVKILEWESNEIGVLFHQPLFLSTILAYMKEDPMNIHPFNIHSPIRVQLQINNPISDIDEDATKLCILIIDRIHIGAPLQHFLNHYYGLDNVSGSYNEVATFSSGLTPLLIVLRPGFSQHEKAVLRDMIISHTNVHVMDWPTPMPPEEINVCRYVKRNVIHGCKMIQSSQINESVRQFEIFQRMLVIILQSSFTQKRIPNITEGSYSYPRMNVPLEKLPAKSMSNMERSRDRVAYQCLMFRRKLKQFLDKVGSSDAQEHPHRDSTLLVLCKPFVGGTTTQRNINAVELYFGSQEAMSHCIGVGVERAVVRHDSSSTSQQCDLILIKQLHGVEWLPSAEVTFETITEEGYVLLEVVTYDGQSTMAGTDHDIHDEERARSQKDLLRMYGVAFEEEAGAVYSLSTMDDEIETATESSDLQKHGAEKTDDIAAAAEAPPQYDDEEKTETDIPAYLAKERSDDENEGEYGGCDDEGERCKQDRSPKSCGDASTGVGMWKTRDTDKNEARKEGEIYGSRNGRGEGGGGTSRSRTGNKDGVGEGSGNKDRNGGEKSQDGGRDGRSGNGDGRGGGGGGGGDEGGDGGGRGRGGGDRPDGGGGERDKSQSQLFTKHVGVHLYPGGEFDTNNEHHILLKNKDLLDISPQFKFQFDLHRGDDPGLITIENRTLFEVPDDEEWYHDEIKVKIGSKEKNAASLFNDCFEQMNQNEVTVEALPKKPTTTSEIEVKGSIAVAEAKVGASRTWEGHSNQLQTYCSGFDISNHSGSHFGSWKLTHVEHNPRKHKTTTRCVQGLQTTICPKFKIAFIPRNNDGAAKYMFHASRMWAHMQSRSFLSLRKGDPHSQGIRQSYDADFKLNHDLASLLGVWDHAHNRQFVEPQLQSGQFNYFTIGY